MPNIKITGREGWSDCDDCGPYDWENINVEVDGKQVLRHSADDHMGGGMWRDWQTAVRDILTAMGHTVEINIGFTGGGYAD